MQPRAPAHVHGYGTYGHPASATGASTPHGDPASAQDLFVQWMRRSEEDRQRVEEERRRAEAVRARERAQMLQMAAQLGLRLPLMPAGTDSDEPARSPPAAEDSMHGGSSALVLGRPSTGTAAAASSPPTGAQLSGLTFSELKSPEALTSHLNSGSAAAECPLSGSSSRSTGHSSGGSGSGSGHGGGNYKKTRKMVLRRLGPEHQAIVRSFLNDTDYDVWRRSSKRIQSPAAPLLQERRTQRAVYLQEMRTASNQVSAQHTTAGMGQVDLCYARIDAGFWVCATCAWCVCVRACTSISCRWLSARGEPCAQPAIAALLPSIPTSRKAAW